MDNPKTIAEIDAAIDAIKHPPEDLVARIKKTNAIVSTMLESEAEQDVITRWLAGQWYSSFGMLNDVGSQDNPAVQYSLMKHFVGIAATMEKVGFQYADLFLSVANEMENTFVQIVKLHELRSALDDNESFH